MGIGYSYCCWIFRRDCPLIEVHQQLEVILKISTLSPFSPESYHGTDRGSYPAEEGGYVALNHETGTTTQGERVEEAITNLTEATALYLSEFPLPARSNRKGVC